jgi:hypothetical protein
MSSGWSRDSLAGAIVLTSVCGLGAYEYRATQPTADTYTRAYALVKAVYPAFAGQGLVFMVSGDRWRSFDELVTPLTSVVIAIGKQEPRAPVQKVFSAHIEFTSDGTLYDFLADPDVPLLNQGKVEALGKVLSSHEDWTEQQIAAAIKAAGARFGPDRQREMERVLEGHLQRIGAVLGSMKAGPLHFVTDDNNPGWSCDVVISTPVGEKTYGALIEPFEGRLYALSRAGR